MSPSPASRVCTAAIVAGALAGTRVSSVDASWDFELDTGMRHGTNLTRAHHADDRRSDWALLVDMAAMHAIVVTGYDVVTLRFNARGERHHRYRGLDLAAVGASVGYRHKFALGPTAPYPALGVTVDYEDYRVDLRSGLRTEAHAEVGRRFDAPFDAAFGVAVDRRNARSDVPIVPGVSGAIVDLAEYGAYMRTSYSASDRTWLTARASVRRGDVQSTSQRGPAVFRASDAIADDPAFEDPALFGYRLRGTTFAATLSMTHAIGERATVGASYTDEHTRASEGLSYRSRFLGAVVSWRF